MDIKKYRGEPVIKASEAEPGDWILIFARNKPEGSDKNPKLKGTGASSFDVIESRVEPTKQAGNGRVRVFFRGSISENTLVQVTNRRET